MPSMKWMWLRMYPRASPSFVSHRYENVIPRFNMDTEDSITESLSISILIRIVIQHVKFRYTSPHF